MIRTLAICALMLSSIVQPRSEPRVPIQTVGWFSSADPVIQGYFDRAALEELRKTKQAALRETDGFVIQNGYVFYLDFKNAPTYVGDSSDVRQILMFKGKLVALDSKRDVYLLTENDGPNTGEWYQLGNSTDDLETDDVDLFALTSTRGWFSSEITRGVWVYKGQPGEMTWTVIPILIPVSCGNNMTCFTTMYVPTQGGRQVAFDDLGVPDAVGLIREGTKVFALTTSGNRLQVTRTLP